MNSHDNENTTDADPGAGDDVTLAAGGDVVAQIRAHAAKVRRGEVAADEGLQVWTADDATIDPAAIPTPAMPAPVEPEADATADIVDVREPGTLLPNDETVPLESTRAELAQAIAEAKAFRADTADTSQNADIADDDYTEPPVTVRTASVDREPVVDLRRSGAVAPTGGASLIEGQAPPQVSTSFWETDQPFRASGIDGPSRLRGSRGVPLMAWIALVIVVIVIASVGIAVAVATTGPVT